MARLIHARYRGLTCIRITQFDLRTSNPIKTYFKSLEFSEKAYATWGYDIRGNLIKYRFIYKRRGFVEKYHYMSLKYDENGELVSYEDYRGNHWKGEWQTPMPFYLIFNQILDNAQLFNKLVTSMHRFSLDAARGRKSMMRYE